MYRVRMRDPRWEARERYMAGIVPEYNEYVGVVSDAPPYLDDEWFTLTEENGNVRILFKENVICSFEHRNHSGNDKSSQVVRIPRGDKSYTVTLIDGIRFSCNCTGFGYRHSCSHVREVEEAL